MPVSRRSLLGFGRPVVTERGMRIILSFTTPFPSELLRCRSESVTGPRSKRRRQWAGCQSRAGRQFLLPTLLADVLCVRLKYGHWRRLPAPLLAPRWSGDPELFHFGNQSRPRQSKPGGGATRSSDNPTRPLQCVQDQRSRGIPEGFLRRSYRKRFLQRSYRRGTLARYR